MPEVTSYDQNQMDTVLRECPQCRKSYYMRPWRFVCVSCDDPWRLRESRNSYRSLRNRKVDVQGNFMGDGP